MQNPTLEQILNRTEALDFTKTYKYAQQQGLSGKPALFATNESLKSYPLKIKLHQSFCNPQKVIKEIEQRAKNRQVINWFQHGKYVGDFFIERYSVKINQKVNDVITYAEIQLTLLENPDKYLTFEQQSKIVSKINSQKYKENSTVVKEISKKSSVYDTTIKTLESSINEDLSDSASQIYRQTKSIILKKIQDEGLSNAQNIVNKLCLELSTQNVLSLEEYNMIKSDLEKIPITLYNAVVRNV